MANPSIFIVGTPRSGTTSLIRGFSSYYNTMSSLEPWNPKRGEFLHISDPTEVTKYSLVKSLTLQRPVGSPEMKASEFYKDVFTKYDHVILLGRKNIHDLSFSLGYQHQKNDLEQYPSHNWHSTYTVDDELIKPMYTLAAEYFTELAEISESTSIPITWYEDIYSGDKEKVSKFFNSLNLDINVDRFMKYLNPENRLRKFGNKITKI